MTQKLPKWIFKEYLKNIDSWKIKNFLEENKWVFWVKEFTKDYLMEVLKDEKKKNISQEDFEIMEDYVENIKEYQEVLKENIPNKDFSITFIKKLIFWQTIEEFKEFCNNLNVEDVLTFWEDKNIENLIKLYNIKTVEEFKEFCNNKTRYIVEFGEENNVENVIKLYNIKTVEKFEELFDNEEVIDILELWEEKNVENVFTAYKTEEQRIKLIEFLNKRVFNSKKNTNILFEREYNSEFKNFRNIFLYYLENKQKSVISMIKMLWDVELFKLGINLDKIKVFSDFIDEKWDINKEELKIKYKKMLDIINDKKKEKKLKQFNDAMERKNKKVLEKIMIESGIKYFDLVYNRKLKIKINSELQKVLWYRNIKLDDIKDEKLKREEFIEAYKILLNTIHNKEQINQLLYDYLMWKFDNIKEWYIKWTQYDTKKNKEWLDKYLSKGQQGTWLSKHKEIINIEVKNEQSDKETKENIEIRINNHFEISVKKLEEINKLWFNLKTSFRNDWELVNYFGEVVKKEEDEIKKKNNSLYEDLKLQIDSIKELYKINKSKKVNQIIIEKELDPLNILMMWNWVDWSCLSFYSNVKNYYSSISNAIDVNKWVFYIKDERWNILWRCIITIWDDKKLSRYDMYYRWNISAQIDKYFDKYTRKLANKLWLELNWDEDKVKNIECDEWYKDGVKKV